MDMYNRIRVIGKGSYGEVWLVKHKKDRKQYVLKKMELHNASKRERKAAEQEAKLLSKLRHPNIVSYKDSFETEEGFLYIAMGYCEGGDLYSKLKEQRGSPLEERQVVEWFVQIAMALQYMHERHILHRDLKTQNIFLTKSKIIKVGDLGIARVLDSSNDMATTLIGTPYYMSPELFSNKPYNHKSDVWALGCCVYEMSTLKHAFNAKDMNSLVYKILRGKMPNMPRSYSPELVTLIKAMLNQNPDKRPSVNRILRDPYIKRNIAIFLEGTKNRNRPSSSRRPSRDSKARSAGSRDATDNEDAKSNVTSASQISQISNISAYNHVDIEVTPEDEKLPPLEVGNVLEPILEIASPSSTAELSEKPKAASPVKKSVEGALRGSGEGPVPPPSGQEQKQASPGRGNGGVNGGVGAVSQVSSQSKVSSSDDRYNRPRRRRSRDEDAESVASVDSVSSRGGGGQRAPRQRLVAATPRPLPPRPMSAEAPPSQGRAGRVRDEESSSTSGSLGSSAEKQREEESSQQKMQVNESARARRRRQKEKEEDTPKAAVERHRVEASENRVLIRPKPRGHTKAKSDPFPRAGLTEPLPVLKKDFEFQKHPVPVPRKNRQPSITEDSSSSAEEVDEVDDAASVSSEVVHERENKRKEKEMKNFISLLDTTLRMNKDDDKSDDDNSPKEPEPQPAKPQMNQRPIHRVNSSPSQPVVAEKTMSATGRLMERITALRKDCIRGLGVQRLKLAYDVLDNIEGDELEPRLVEILGKDNFDLYAGKIWQLKFCEESAFGLN